MRDKEFPQKKVLSLVLCVAVMLSVMVMGAGAAFSDQDKIENTEAVDACIALNIIGGYEDGSYHPERNIKRSEITKMICVALNGGKEPNVGTNVTPTFSDVRGTSAAWAEGYIESCVAQGIVSGVGGGRFSPNGNVTGTQLAKMLLVSLGYNADTEGFVGNAWATNVNVVASQKGLYEGLESMDTSAAITRDNAAQMVWNALNAYEVEYKTTIITGEDGKLETIVTVQDKVVGTTSDKITLLKDKYNAWVNVGTLTGISSNTITITMSDADKAVSDLEPASGVNTVSFSKLTTDYSNLLGQKVKVMFKDGKVNEVLGVYATSDNTVYTTVANAIDNDNGKIKFDDNSYSVEYTKVKGNTTNGTTGLATYRDGEEVNALDVTNLANMNSSADKVILIDTNDNGKIDTVYFTTVTVAKVTYASASQIVAGGTTYKHADENIADGITKNDWVIITENAYNNNKDIAKAEMTKATIQGYKDETTYHQYRVDGTWYNTADNKKLDAKAGDTANVVLVNGIIFYADKVSGTADSLDVALVVEVGSFNQAKLAFVDGTTKTVTIDTTGTTPTNGTVYCYEVDGDEYKLSALTTLDNDDYTLLTTGTIDNWSGTATPTTVDGKAIDDNAKVVLYTKNGTVADSKLITGKQFKTVKFSGAGGLQSANATALGALTSTVAGIEKVSVLFVNAGTKMPDSFQSNANYAYVVESSYTSSSDYKTYSIFDGEKTIEVTEKTSASRAVGDIIGYESIEDGVIKDVTLYTAGAGYTVGALRGIDADGKGFTVDGKDHYNVTADTKVILINSDDSGDQVGVPGNALSADYEADEIGDSGYYYNNAKYILDGAPGDDVDVKIVVVDVVNNKMADVAQPVAVETANPGATAINNALTAAGSDGTVVVTGTLPASGVNQIEAGQTLVLTSAQTTSSLEALKANAGATLVIQKESTGNNVTANKWFHGTDGSAAAYSGQKVPAATYKYSSDADGSSHAGWVCPG